MRISKEFKFEMAHKLHKSYTCKCQNIHGHSYKASVEIEGFINYDSGVVEDFTKIKEALGIIFEALDHACMICKHDVEVVEMLQLLTVGKKNQKLIVCSSEPTAENIAAWILNRAAALLLKNLIHFNDIVITLYETASSKVVISRNDLISTVVPRMTFIGYDHSLSDLLSSEDTQFNEPFNIFEGFYPRYTEILVKLINLSLYKFQIHNQKDDWRFRNLDKVKLFEEFYDEVRELFNSKDGDELNKELADILNYIVITYDIEKLKGLI